MLRIYYIYTSGFRKNVRIEIPLYPFFFFLYFTGIWTSCPAHRAYERGKKLYWKWIAGKSAQWWWNILCIFYFNILSLNIFFFLVHTYARVNNTPKFSMIFLGILWMFGIFLLFFFCCPEIPLVWIMFTFGGEKNNIFVDLI